MEAERAVALYSGMVYRLAYMYTKNFADAQDIVQEVFIAYIRKKPVFSCPEQERAWLARCAKNKSLNLLRSPFIKRTVVLTEMPETASQQPGGVLSCVMELPQKLKSAVYMFYYEGLDVRQTAKALSISESAVKTRLCRARELLRSALKEEYDYEEIK